jgi:hypothetical protein
MTVSYDDLSPDSRLWIYSSKRALNADEQVQILKVLKQFTDSWQAHGKEVHSRAEIRKDRFILLFADESKSGVTGCSIDASVSVFREIEQAFHLDIFNRMNFFLSVNGNIELLDRNALESVLASGQVNGKSLIFDNMISSKAELEHSWLKPLEESKYSRLFSIPD